MQEVKKKTILIGGSGSIGRAFLSILLARGDEVINVSRRCPAVSHVDSLQHVAVDLRDHVATKKAINSLKLAPGSVARVVCCAGSGLFGRLENQSDQEVINHLMINFTAQALIVKQFIPLLANGVGSRIVWLGSEAGIRGAREGTIYCAAKFAARGFCQALRDELRTRLIHVSYVAPGLTQSDFFNELTFTPDIEAVHAMRAEDVALAMVACIDSSNHCVIEEMRLQPVQPKISKK